MTRNSIGYAFAVLTLVQGPLFAQGRMPTRNGPEIRNAFKAVVTQPGESTVKITFGDQVVAHGVVVDANGLILTKASEIRGKVVCHFQDGKAHPGKIVALEENSDLCLIKVSATGLKPISWESSAKIEVGDWLAAPGVDSKLIAAGVLSVGPRKPGRMEMPRTAPTQKSGYLGVLLEPQSDGQPSIGRITEGSPAEKAGLQQGDVVLSVDGRTVRNVEKLIATIQGFKPGAVVAIKVQRGDEKLLFSPKLGRFPVDILSRGERMNMMGGELSHRLGGFPVILQHDLQIKPQDCGGPVVNLDGKAIGINIARAGRTESYAIPSDEVLKLLPEMINGRYAVNDDHQEERMAKLETTLANLKEDIRKAQQKLRDLPESTPDKKRKELKKNLDELKAEMKNIYEELETLKPEKKAP